MPARHLCRLMNVLPVLAVLMLGTALVLVVAAPLADQPLLHSWDVRTHAPVPGPALAGSAALAEPNLALDRADLTLQIDGGAGLLLKALEVLVLGCFWLATLWWLRGFAIDVRRGVPFTAGSADRLRRVGLLLIAFPLWQALSAGLWQWLLLRSVVPLDPSIALLPSLSRTPAGVDAGRLMVDVDPGYAIAGLVLLVVAHAFRSGIALRIETSEFV